MRFHVGSAAISWAKRNPSITRVVLGAMAKSYIAFPRRRSRFFDVLAGETGYLVRVSAQLGNGMKISVPWNDVGGNEIYNTGWYEPSTVRIVSSMLKPGMTFFDVGANVGQYTLLGSGLVGNAGAVHSFEPAPPIFQWLCDNVGVNSLKNVQLNQCALGASSEPLTLHLAKPENFGATSVCKQYHSSGQTFDVSCTRIDDYMVAKGISRVDVMKIDVEGAEMAVLEGGEKLFGSPHPPTLIIEYEESSQKRFGRSCEDITKFLRAFGYSLERITDTGTIPYQVKQPEDFSFNVLARPREAAQNSGFGSSD